MSLNAFNEEASPRGSLMRFQWVLNGAVARSSQPGYTGGDAPHDISASDVAILRAEGIKTVISANHCELSDEGKDRLSAAGIEFFHFPVADFKPHTVRQLEESARLLRNKPPALVYCGYGQGRTGTVVAGWAIISRLPGVLKEDSYLKNTFGVETDEQLSVLKRL